MCELHFVAPKQADMHTATQERHDQHALSSCVCVQDIPTTGPYLSCHASSPGYKQSLC